MNNTAKGLIYATISAIAWGILAIAIRVSLHEAESVEIIWIRFFMASILLIGYQIFKDPKGLRILIRPPKLLVFSAIAIGLNYYGFTKGVHLTSPNNAAVFIQSGPLLLALAGIFLFKEPFSKFQVFGFSLGILGFYLFYAEQLTITSGQFEHYNLGIVLVLGAGLLWAFYSVCQKRLIGKYTSVQLNMFNFGLPAILWAPFVDFGAVTSYSMNTYWLLLYLVLTTIVAYGCLSMALKYAPANKVSILLSANPVLTFIIMAILMAMNVSWAPDETISFKSIIGAGLVILGAVIATLKRHK